MGVEINDINLTGDDIISKDGFSISIRLKVSLSVQNDDKKVFRLYNDEKTENDNLQIAIKAYSQKFVCEINALDAIGNSMKFYEFLNSKKEEIASKFDLCYVINNLSITTFKYYDNELNKLFQKTLIDVQKEEQSRKLTIAKLDTSDIEKKYQEKELLNQIEIDKIKILNNIEVEKQKAAADIELAKLKTISEIEIEKSKLSFEKLKKETELFSKIEESKLLTTEEGRLALFPQETFELLRKEIEVSGLEESGKQKLLTNLVNQMLQSGTSYKAGQLDAMKQLLATHFNINLTEYGNVQSNDQTKDLGNSDKQLSQNTDQQQPTSD